MTLFRSRTAGKFLEKAAPSLLAVLLSSQLLWAATPSRKASSAEFERALPLKQQMARPTRPADLQPSPPLVGEEVFVERFADGSIKVEREVALDPEGNYVNHGAWRMWDQGGKLQAEGAYHYGKKTGIWNRWYDRNDAKLFSQQPFRKFRAPFLSQASFDQDILDGEWSILDAQQNRCCQISLRQGKRDGLSLYWQPDGTLIMQSLYEQGVPTGEVLQLSRETGELVETKQFLDGREWITKKSMHRRSRQVKFEGSFLAPTSQLTAADDFTTLQFAKYEPQGEELRHGNWQQWYSNGQPKIQGQYDHDQKVGRFTYWHSNGQKAAEGEYRADHPEGLWVWWHQNGQKSVTGSFDGGLMVAQWRWWAENGKLVKQTLEEGTQAFEALAKERSPADPNARALSKPRLQR